MSRTNWKPLAAATTPIVVFCAVFATAPFTRVRAASEPVTFSRQIAPIFYKNCSGCHHVGGAGPFSLISYADAKRWGKLIATVTQRRYMPPWLPEPGFGDFADSRRLPDESVALIKAWVESGMPQGNAAEAPRPPVFPKEWQLGQPDLVLEVETAITVPAEGTDLFRNLILPVPIEQTKYIRAMEIRPGVAKVVHHANVLIDRTASLRRQHAADWKQGIPGMEITVDSGESFDPDSHFLFWKPDSPALVEPEGLPWRLDPGNDLILNMHLKPTGKPETVLGSIGLYFTDAPPTAHPILLQLEHDGALDIPAGDPAFVVEDQLTLPVDVDVLGVYPHAHYLGKRMEGYALLPSGEKKWLVLIADWDINRQAVYRFRQPLFLPKGSVLHMRYTFDNSEANIRNPSSPPVRVKAGNRSVDEMGHLWLQVLPHAAAGSDDDPRVAIERVWMENRLRKDPTDHTALYNLASMEMMTGRYASAAELYNRALAQVPDDSRAITALGTALDRAGEWQQAEAEFEKALAIDPDSRDARYDLAQLAVQHGDYSKAELEFRRLLQDNPRDAAAHAELGAILSATGRMDEAQAELKAAIDLDPSNFDALFNLASLEGGQGNLAASASLLERALKQKNDADAHELLGSIYAQLSRNEEALAQFHALQLLRPGDAAPHLKLAQVYAVMSQTNAAINEQTAALTVDPQNADGWNFLGELHLRLKDTAAARKDFERALAVNPNHQEARANLARL